MQRVVLPEVECLLIEGPDARSFAQAQCSGDVESLAPGRWRWNAWLDAQGRVQALMHLAELGDGRLLAMLRGGGADTVRTGLARYVFRAKVSMTAHIFSGHADAGLPMGHVDTRTPGVIAFGYGDRSLRLGPGNTAADSEAANAWRLADIRCGWPTLPVGVAAFLPPALALESLGAVSLGKGCYPGQEIVARLHYRGGHKTRMYHVRGPRPLEAGTAAHSDGGPIRVLACAMAADGQAEALIVASQDLNNIFNILEDEYQVVSRYDP